MWVIYFFTLPFCWLDHGVANISAFLADEVKLLAQVVAVKVPFQISFSVAEIFIQMQGLL